MSVLHRDNLNEINLKSLPGVDFNKPGPVTYVFMALHAFFIAAVFMDFNPSFLTIFPENSVLVVLIKSIIVLSIIISYLIGLHFDIGESSSALFIYRIFALLTFLCVVALFILFCLYTSVHDYGYKPAVPILEYVGQVLQLIENFIRNIVGV